MGGQGRSVIEWGWAGEALGERDEGSESGDLHVVVTLPEGALVAAIDGLGHGTAAAEAAEAAARVLEAYAGEPLVALVERCHAALRRTRGVVMSLVSFDARDSTMTAVGVGNVDVVLLRARPGAAPPGEALTLRGGIVGYQLPPLRPTAFSLLRGDTVIMATDGIRGGFTSGLSLTLPPQETATSILAGHGKRSDDALVVVVRYLGAAA